jgi:hypothetical protein
VEALLSVVSANNTTHVLGSLDFRLDQRRGYSHLKEESRSGIIFQSYSFSVGAAGKKWKGVTNDDQSQLPSQSFCLQSGPRKFPPEPPARQCYHQASWRDTERVEILSKAPSWIDIDVHLDVTLVLTLQITESQATNEETLNEIIELMVEGIARWQGQPCVIVIHLAGATESSTLVDPKGCEGSRPAH